MNLTIINQATTRHPSRSWEYREKVEKLRGRHGRDIIPLLAGLTPAVLGFLLILVTWKDYDPNLVFLSCFVSIFILLGSI